ncbi:hypothetical protein LY78DRAFT_696864 [Colletotrichum sublineola]|nr:hypothetical protein LY78DRAFT_696864 [Colletotrichum sublineola]
MVWDTVASQLKWRRRRGSVQARQGDFKMAATPIMVLEIKGERGFQECWVTVREV